MNPSVLITGASGNLGSAVVEKFLQNNYRVYATARDINSVKGAETAAVDLTKEVETGEYIESIAAQDSHLKTAVLLVGGYATGDIAATNSAALQKMYQLNFETTYFVVRALLPYFEANGGGHFVFVSSRSALHLEQAKNTVAYSLSKSLVNHLATIINASEKDKGIRASVIVPSIIDTPQNRQAMPNADTTKWTTPEALAESIFFLQTNSGKHLRETVLKLYNES